MQRVTNLCVITGIVLLAAGILVPHLTPNTAWALHWRGMAYGLSWQTPCYGLAALFSLFALLYSIGYLPFDKTAAQWHFWLSLGCVALFVLGMAIFYVTVRGGTTPKLGVAGTALAVSVLASIPIFVVAQLFFAVALVRALMKMHPA